MKQLRHLFPVLAALFLLTATVWVVRITLSRPDDLWHPVLVDRSPRILHEVGTLEAKELVQLQTRIRGTVTELHPDGTPVKPGDVVLRFDQEELQNQLEAELEDLEQTREDYTSQVAEYTVLTNSFTIQTRLKLAERDHAALELEWGTTPLQPEERALMEIEVELARLDLEEKQAEIERQKELVKRNFAPPSSLDRLTLELASARTFLEEKQSQLALAGQPVTEEERLTLQAAVDKAEKEVRRNGEQQALQLRIQELELEGLRLELKHKEEEIADKREQLEHAVIRSPVKGILRLFRDYSWSSKTWQPLSVGKDIHARDMVATVVDPSQLSLSLMLHESDVSAVKEGQKVQATLTAYPDEVISGTISSVSEVGQDRDDLSPLYRQAQPIGQALFRANVHLEEINPNAMPGMTTHVQIEVAPPEERLFIPRSALLTDSPPYQVVRSRDGQVETVTVEGDFDLQGRFEVTRGLREGDRVKETGAEPSS
jgi:HlyD family secretion protein